MSSNQTPLKYFTGNSVETPNTSRAAAARPRTAEWFRPAAAETASKNETNDRKTPAPTSPLSPVRHNRTRDWCSPSSTTPALTARSTARITPYEPFELEFSEAMKLRQKQLPAIKDKRPMSALTPVKSLANSFSAAKTPARVGSAPMTKKPLSSLNFAALPQLLQPHPLLVRLESEFGLRSIDREHLEQSKAPIGSLPFQISQQILQEDKSAAAAALEAAKTIPDKSLPMRKLVDQLQQEYWSIERSIKHAQAIRVELQPFIVENYLLCIFCDPSQPATLRHRSFELLTHPLMLDMPIYGETHAWCPWLNKTHGSAIRGLLLHYAVQGAYELIVERVCMLIALILQIDTKERARTTWMCWAETMSTLVLDSAVAQRPLQPVLLDLSQPVDVLFRRPDAKSRPSAYDKVLRSEGFQKPESASEIVQDEAKAAPPNAKLDEASIAFAVLRVFHDHLPTLLGYQTLAHSWLVQLVRYILTTRLRVLRENDAIILQCYLLDTRETEKGAANAGDAVRMYVDVPWRPADSENINWFKWTTFNRLLASCAAEEPSANSGSNLPSAYSWLSRSMHAHCMDGFLGLFVPIVTAAGRQVNRTPQQREEVTRLYIPWMKSLLKENEADEDRVMLSGLLLVHLYDLFLFDEPATKAPQSDAETRQCCFDLADPVQASVYKFVPTVIERTLQSLQKRLLSLYASDVEWLQPWSNFDPNNSAMTLEERRQLQSALLEEQLRIEFDRNHVPIDMGPNYSRSIRASPSRTFRPFHNERQARLQLLHATALKLSQLEEEVRQNEEMKSTDNKNSQQHISAFDTCFDEVVQLLVVQLGLVPDADEVHSSVEFDDHSLVIAADTEVSNEMADKRKKAIVRDVKLLFTLLFVVVQVAPPKWLANNQNMVQYLVKRGAEAKQMCVRLQAMDLLSCVMLIDPSYHSLSRSQDAEEQIELLEAQYFLSSKALNDAVPQTLRQAVQEACAQRSAKEISAAKQNGLAVASFPTSIAGLIEGYAIPSRNVYFSYLPFVVSCARSLNFSSRRLSHGWLCTAHKNGGSSLNMPSDAFESLWTPFVELATLDTEEETLRQELSITLFKRVHHGGLTTALAPANWRLLLLKRLGIPADDEMYVELPSPDADQALVDVALSNPSPVILEALLKSSFSIAARVLNLHSHLIRRSVITGPLRSLKHQRYVTHKRCDTIAADPAAAALVGHAEEEQEEEEEADDEEAEEDKDADDEDEKAANESAAEDEKNADVENEETEVPSDDDSGNHSDTSKSEPQVSNSDEDDNEADQSPEQRVERYVSEIQSDSDLAAEAMQQAEEALGEECVRGRWDTETAKRLYQENFKPSSVSNESRSASVAGGRPSTANAAAAARGLESGQDFRGWCVFEGETNNLKQDELEGLEDDRCPSEPLPIAVHILRIADRIVAEQEDDPVMLPGGSEALILSCASEVCAQLIVLLRWAVLHSQRLEWGDDPLTDQNTNRNDLEDRIKIVANVLQFTQLQRHADVAALFSTLVPFLRRFVDLFLNDGSEYNKQEWALSIAQACAASPLFAAPVISQANSRSDNYILHRLAHLALPPIADTSNDADGDAEKNEIRKVLERQRRRTAKQMAELLQSDSLKGVQTIDPQHEPISQQALRALFMLRYNESPIANGEESSSSADREDWLSSPIISYESASQVLELLLSTYNVSFTPKMLEILQSPTCGESQLQGDFSMTQDGNIEQRESWSEEPFLLFLTYCTAMVAFRTQLPEDFEAFPPARLLSFRLLHAALCGNVKEPVPEEDDQNAPLPLHPVLVWMTRENRRIALVWSADCLAWLSETEAGAELKAIPAERLSRMLSEIAIVLRERMDLGALQHLRQVAIRCGHHV